jgi:hypothetical protein
MTGNPGVNESNRQNTGSGKGMKANVLGAKDQWDRSVVCPHSRRFLMAKMSPWAALAVYQDNQHNRCKIRTGGPDSGTACGRGSKR